MNKTRNKNLAINRLYAGLLRYQQDIRDGLIQRFECTYELSHKMLKRYLKHTSATPAQYDSMPFQDRIRSANEPSLLLGDWPKWKVFRDMRSKTSPSMLKMWRVMSWPESLHLSMKPDT